MSSAANTWTPPTSSREVLSSARSIPANRSVTSAVASVFVELGRRPPDLADEARLDRPGEQNGPVVAHRADDRGDRRHQESIRPLADTYRDKGYQGADAELVGLRRHQHRHRVAPVIGIVAQGADDDLATALRIAGRLVQESDRARRRSISDRVFAADIVGDVDGNGVRVGVGEPVEIHAQPRHRIGVVLATLLVQPLVRGDEHGFRRFNGAVERGRHDLLRSRNLDVKVVPQIKILLPYIGAEDQPARQRQRCGEGNRDELGAVAGAVCQMLYDLGHGTDLRARSLRIFFLCARMSR